MSLGSPNIICLYSCSRRKCPDRSCERFHRCFRFSLCASSVIGCGRSLSTLLFLMSRIYRICVQVLVAFSLACTESRKNSGMMSRVKSILHGSRSCSWAGMPWQTWSSSRQFTRYWSLTISIRDSWWRWLILVILWSPVAVLSAVCIFLKLESLALVL